MLKMYLKKLGSAINSGAGLLISGYQIFISPILSQRGHACRFYPTCSQYFLQATKKFGMLKGGLLGLKRVFRCHPFGHGGWDPVP